MLPGTAVLYTVTFQFLTSDALQYDTNPTTLPSVSQIEHGKLVRYT